MAFFLQHICVWLPNISVFFDVFVPQKVQQHRTTLQKRNTKIESMLTSVSLCKYHIISVTYQWSLLWFDLLKPF